jgi:predicted DNA binding protein
MEGDGRTEQTGSHLTLSIWHPDCWTLEVTDHSTGGLLGHGVYHAEETVKGRFTAYADSERDLEIFLDDIRESPLTDAVWEMAHRYDFDRQVPSPGNVTQSLLVAYDEGTSINDALISNGFIPDKAVWMHDGREYWTVAIDEDRDQIQDRIDSVREEMNADIEIQQIVADGPTRGGVLQQRLLSVRQREIFEHARERGYYNWPREVNATELAAELDISKPTFLEHLRKAEAKLFDSML